jgi:hypothetical protein
MTYNGLHLDGAPGENVPAMRASLRIRFEDTSVRKFRY